MKKLLTMILLSCAVIAVSNCSWAADKAPAAEYVYLFDGTKPDTSAWKDRFEDGSSTEARIYLGKPNIPPGMTMAKIEGLSMKQSFGGIYQDVTVNLDKYPYLEVNVDSLVGMWYIILLNEDLKNAEQEESGSKYVRVQPDTLTLGKFRYDLKKITGLSGLNTFRVKIGISTGVSESFNRGKYVVFKYIRFSSI